MKSPSTSLAPWDISVVIVLFGALVGAEVMMLMRDTDAERYYLKRDREKTAMVDQLDFVDTSAAFRAGASRHVVILDDEPARLTLDDKRQKGFPRDGDWTSSIVSVRFPFTELLPCWNVATPADTGVVFHVRTRDRASAQWTPWLRVGAWGRVTGKERQDNCAFGRVDVDTLRLDRPADAYQIRATLQSFGLALNVTPAVRRIAVTYSGAIAADSVWAAAMHPDAGPAERWARDLNIPYHPQGDNDYAVTGMTCSPTSVSMVLEYWGVDRPTMENCLAIWDDHNELFGNWCNATQRAAELGMDSWLQRFRNWEQVKEMISAGQPIVASIRWEKGTFDNSPIFRKTGTDGHLIVIRGFTRSGDVIVNDPGNREKGNRVIYPAHGLAHAWFGNGGVGYVIRPPAKPLPASLVKLPPATAPSVASSNVKR